MSQDNQFENLTKFLSVLHIRLFPEGYTEVSKEELWSTTKELTSRINFTLNEYHKLTEVEQRMQLKPTLIYSQALLSHLTRLLKFDQKDLTKYNQIVVDLEKMLINRDGLISSKYQSQAEFELKMMNDKKFKNMLKACAESFFFQMDR